jgi:hypothetical protein
LSLSRDSSLRSERGAAKPAPAPATSKKKKGQPATPPTEAEVEAYAAAQYPGQPAAPAEAAAFHDHFQSNGWRVGGKTPMVDWQAAFRGWMRRRAAFQGTQAPATPPGRARTAPKPADLTRWS